MPRWMSSLRSIRRIKSGKPLLETAEPVFPSVLRSPAGSSNVACSALAPTETLRQR